jgi:hypothetical protein
MAPVDERRVPGTGSHCDEPLAAVPRRHPVARPHLKPGRAGLTARRTAPAREEPLRAIGGISGTV